MEIHTYGTLNCVGEKKINSFQKRNNGNMGEEENVLPIPTKPEYGDLAFLQKTFLPPPTAIAIIRPENGLGDWVLYLLRS
jgi:hypothetical protein